MRSLYDRQLRIPVALCLCVAAASPAPAQFTIARPSFGVPVFAQPGGTIQVEVKAAAGLDADGWGAGLANDLRTWTGTVAQAEYGSYVENDTTTGYRLTIRIPADISPEVFQLTIWHPGGGTATNVNAVGIVPDFESDFYILHYADPQAGGFEPTDPETGQCGKHGSIREIYWHAPALRLINPRFMFDTGDELDDPYYAYSVTNYQQYLAAMGQIGVPVVITRGNNDDLISTEDWRRTIGIETYSLAMGSFYVCQKDYNEDHFTAWLTNNYAAACTNPAIGFRLFGQHFSDSGCSWLPPAGQYPDLMLVGHIHVNSTVLSAPYPILSTEAAFTKGAVSLFEFSHSGTNWTCPTLTNLPAAQFRVMASGAVARIACTYDHPNDGTSPANTATIVNGIPLRFWSGRLRFLMPYATAGYDVSNGTIVAQYPYNQDSNLAVVVKVDIAASNTTVVGIQPSAAPPAANGTPAWWLVQHGLPANAVGEGYDEGDGIPAWQEYVADTNPTNAGSCFRITAASAPPPESLHFESSSNRVYGVRGCTNLLEGIWTPVAGLEPRPGAGGDDVLQVSNANPYQLYRLSVGLPETPDFK